MDTRRLSRIFAAIVLVVVALGAGGLMLRNWYRDHTPTVDESGVAVSQALITQFRGENAIKVASASGWVQSAVVDSRWWGRLNSSRVMKAPFSVEYFVDLSHLSRRDVEWDPAGRRLRVFVPRITVGEPNIDEGHATVVDTQGIFVTRDAANQLARRNSLKNRGLARGEAVKPALLDAAREQARRALAQDLRAPIEAVGQPVNAVEVVFDGEPDPPPLVDPHPMERSRSIRQVFGLDP